MKSVIFNVFLTLFAIWLGECPFGDMSQGAVREVSVGEVSGRESTGPETVLRGSVSLGFVHEEESVGEVSL